MYYIGIDLGGTNIAAGIVDEKGQIIYKSKRPTLSGRPIEEVVKDMAGLSFDMINSAGLDISQIKAIGVGSPGTVDSDRGVIVYSNNLRMDNVPLRKMLAEYFEDKPINIENDANVASYGEYILDGKNEKSFVFITLGTGIGSGVIIDNRLYRGFNGAGAELGHMIINMNGTRCTCGNCGCWEAYASVTALIRQTKTAMQEDHESLMNEWVNEHGTVNGRTAFECAKAGDKTAESVVKKYQEYIACGLINVLNIFQPEKIVVGGGISKEGGYLLDRVKEITYTGDYNKYLKKTEICIAKEKNDAGIIGAALIERSC